LNDVLESLRQVEEREERLLAEIGHELRNPLAVLATSVSVIRQEHKEDRELAQRLETMERQVHALTHRVAQMLDTSRGTSEFSDSREWPPEGTTKTPKIPAGRSSSRGGAVLVVEDHHDGRALLVELLRMWGYTAEGASDGLEGVEVARRLHPDVALVDIDLPEIDGYEVARRIRDDRGDEPIHLIAMSGFGQPEDRLRALAAGFDRHLVKPVDSVRLANLLEETLEGDSEVDSPH
jgi:CheY-like chemotaxis protein